ncbi:MAG TPA: transglutaminase-like domain-containing protein, partial [Pseudomonadales bacterium]|nr:transglutaminase-like domain-containing protein [Pseudomonadales bacterium]
MENHYLTVETSGLTELRSARSVMKSIASVLILTYSFVLYSPAAHAISKKIEVETINSEKQSLEALPDSLDQITNQLKAFQSELEKHEASTPWWKFWAHDAVAQKQHDELKSKIKEIKALDDTFRSYQTHQKEAVSLDWVKQGIDENQVSYKSKMDPLLDTLEKLSTADSQKEQSRLATEAIATLSKYDNGKPKQTWNSDQMPFGVSPDVKREPAKTPQQLADRLKLPLPKPEVSAQKTQSPRLKLSAKAASPALMSAAVPTSSGANDAVFSLAGRALPIPTDAVSTEPFSGDAYSPELMLQDIPEMRRTTTSPDDDYDFINPVYDLVYTELHNDPVQIFNWVHDNIRFIPSYGSIQGAFQTFHNRAGNAMDTASLLIAMLRIAGIPARYVYGTVHVPIK